MYCRLGIITILCLLAGSAVHADDPAGAPREGVLVLRNGQVMRGAITRLGDRYLVSFGGSGEVRLPVNEVEFQCGSLEEAYARKQNAIDPRNLRHRLDLADWCLRHELPHRAADQLLAALTVNPFDTRSLALRRRLLHMAEAKRIADQSQSEPGLDVDWKRIEQTLANTPAPAVEMFTSTIQSMLLNRCGTNACHGSQGNSQYRLLRPLTDSHSLPRRLTQRNLFATLQMVNGADPDSSQLLTIPRVPHGGDKAGLFAGRQERQWEQLRDWVRLAAYALNDEGDSQHAAHDSEGAAETASAPASIPRMTTSIVHNDEIHRSVFTRRPTTGDEAAKSAIADPFDPEVFNRRYFPEKVTPSMANSPAEPASKK